MEVRCSREKCEFLSAIQKRISVGNYTGLISAKNFADQFVVFRRRSLNEVLTLKLKWKKTCPCCKTNLEFNDQRFIDIFQFCPVPKDRFSRLLIRSLKSCEHLDFVVRYVKDNPFPVFDEAFHFFSPEIQKLLFQLNTFWYLIFTHFVSRQSDRWFWLMFCEKCGTVRQELVYVDSL